MLETLEELVAKLSYSLEKLQILELDICGVDLYRVVSFEAIMVFMHA